MQEVTLGFTSLGYVSMTSSRAMDLPTAEAHLRRMLEGASLDSIRASGMAGKLSLMSSSLKPGMLSEVTVEFNNDAVFVDHYDAFLARDEQQRRSDFYSRVLAFMGSAVGDVALNEDGRLMLEVGEGVIGFVALASDVELASWSWLVSVETSNHGFEEAVCVDIRPSGLVFSYASTHDSGSTA